MKEYFIRSPTAEEKERILTIGAEADFVSLREKYKEDELAQLVLDIIAVAEDARLFQDPLGN